MNNIKFLGRGSAFNTQEGNTSLLYKNNNNFYLIDAGYKTFEVIKDTNPLDINRADRIVLFVTHPHEDHFCSDIIFYCYHILKKKIQIVSPDINLCSLLNFMGVDKNTYTFFPTYLYEDKFIKVKFMEINHVPTLVAFSLFVILKQTDYLFFYSGDTNNVDFNQIHRIAKENFVQEINKYYIECSFWETPAHNFYKTFDKKVNNIMTKTKIFDLKQKIELMHIDDNSLIPIMNELGYKFVQCE